MKYLKNTVIATMFVVAITIAPTANAQTTNIEDMLVLIQNLLEQVQLLQEQLNTIRGDLKEAIREGLKQGMTDDGIAEIQELLATDPTLYPEGLVTGYFGPLTNQALKRFQARHELQITGTIDDDTREMLEAYFEQTIGDDIPLGLLRAPGIVKKVSVRYAESCEKQGNSPFCKKIKIKYETDDDDDGSDEGDGVDDENDDAGDVGDAGDDENNDSDNEDSKFEVEIEIEINDDATTTKISFRFDGGEYDVKIESTEEVGVLAAVKEVLNLKEGENINEDLEAEILTQLIDELDEKSDDEGDGDDDIAT